MKFRYFITLCWFLGQFISHVYGQSDSIRTEYKMEDDTISRSEIQRVIRYITRANVEEKTLIKVGLLPNSASFTQTDYVNTIGFDTELSVEQKLGPSLSVLFGLDNQLFLNYTPRNAYDQLSASPGQSPIWLYDRSVSIRSSAKVAVRYYYSMARRIREGRSANNFSGTYIGFQANTPILSYLQVHRHELTSGEQRVEKQWLSLRLFNTLSFGLHWGIQQRLGRRGYIDLNAGPVLSLFDSNQLYNLPRRQQLSLRINAVIGLGW